MHQTERRDAARTPQDTLEPDEALFDPGRTKNYFQYALGSIRRRRALAVGLFSLVVLAATAGLIALPRSYHVEAKLLAQRNAALTVRGDSSGADAPTRAAAETIVRHDNLVAMIETTDLLHHYASHMALAQRLRAVLVGWIQRDWTDNDRLESMVELLGRQIHVWSNDGTVTIAIDWPDAGMARRLVDLAQESFLEARHIQEVSSTAEAVGILQSHAASLRSDIDAAVDVIKDVRRTGRVGGTERPHDEGVRAAASLSTSGPSASRPAEANIELTKLRVTLEAKQRAVDDLDEARRRRLSELQGRLLELRAVYTESHPAVIDLQQTIASLSKDSPQIAGLKKEVATMRAELDRRAPPGEHTGPLATSAAIAQVRAAPAQLPADIVSLETSPPEERDPSMIYARGQLRDAMEKYAALRSQIQAAQIELETAQAAFKYRYAVVTPAQIPKRPAKPNALLIMLAAVASGIFVGILAAIAADVQSGRLVERWQVELVLDKPIFGEVGRRALPPGPET